VRWTPCSDDARVATMAAEKAILCVLFKEFSEPDEISNTCLILQNTIVPLLSRIKENIPIEWKYKQVHHHVDMLYFYYKTLTTNMSSNIFNCCVYRAAADTFVNDFTWTHCASCLFNTAWFIYMLLLILTDPPNKRKLISNPAAHCFQETCRSTRKP